MASAIDEWMNGEHCWKDTDRQKLKYSERNSCQWYFVDHKSHTSDLIMWTLQGNRTPIETAVVADEVKKRLLS